MIFGITYFNLLIRALGVLGVASTVIGFQCKKHRMVLGLRTANELLFGLQYLLLGGYTGAAMNTISSGRNIIFIELVKRGKNTLLWRFFFSAVFVLSAVFTWSGIPSLVFCIGKVTTTFVYGSKNMTLVRIMSLFTSFMWIAYNSSIGAYEGIVSDVLTIISVLIAVIRIDIIERRKSTKVPS